MRALKKVLPIRKKKFTAFAFASRISLRRKP
jgi:hypothetical protein